MTPPTPDLAEWLLTRIGEDEEAAQAATQGEWFRDPPSDESFPNCSEWVRSRSDGAMVIGSFGYDADGVVIDPENEAHILRWQPSRVLAECAAKRAVIEEHAPITDSPLEVTVQPPFCRMCVHMDGFGDDRRPILGQPYPCRTLRSLAAPFSDHPTFREEWRP